MYSSSNPHEQSWHQQITPDQRLQNIQDTAQLLSMFADENSKEKVNNIAQRFEHSVFVSATSLQGYIQSIQMKLSQLRSKAYGDDQSLNTVTPISTNQAAPSQVSLNTPSQIMPSTPPQQQLPTNAPSQSTAPQSATSPQSLTMPIQNVQIHPSQMPHSMPPSELYQLSPPPVQAPQQQFTRRQVEASQLEQIRHSTHALAQLFNHANRTLPYHKATLGEQNWQKFMTINQMYHQHMTALQDNQVVFLHEQLLQVKDHLEHLLHSTNTIEANVADLQPLPLNPMANPNQMGLLPPVTDKETAWMDHVRVNVFGMAQDLQNLNTVYEFPRTTIKSIENDIGPDHMVNPFNLFDQKELDFTRFITHEKIANKRKAEITAPVEKKQKVMDVTNLKMTDVGNECDNTELVHFLNLSWNMAWRGKESILPGYVTTCISDMKSNNKKPTRVIYYCGKPNPDEWWLEHDNLFLRVVGIESEGICI
eukprot:NODE_968_length_2839_cov_0.556569.p1 type:complete len:478 gc:universal NODE_968_length_2839_cov_0.556569:981-2414(+)